MERVPERGVYRARLRTRVKKAEWKGAAGQGEFSVGMGDPSF